MSKSSGFGRRAMARGLGRILFAFMGFVLWAGASAAQVDWLVELSDTGFDPFPAGGTVEYELKVTNNGFGPAGANTVTVDIPLGTTFEGSTGSLTNCAVVGAAGPATITCDVPPLASLESAAAILEVSIPMSGFYPFEANIPDLGVDGDLGNNSNPQTTTITAGADIELNIVAPPMVSSGGILDLSFELTNNGPDPASSMTVTVPVPPGYDNITPPPECTLSGTDYICAVGPIAVGDTVSLDFSGQVSAASNSDITFSASVTDVGPGDAIVTNNLDTADIAIGPGTDLSITKDRSPTGTLLVGDEITWTLSPQYTGESPNGIVVSDTLPANYTPVSVTPAGGWTCSITGQLIECTLPSGTGAGANVPLGDITIVAEAISAGTAVNVAEISAAGPVDQVSSNDSDDDGGVNIEDPVVDLDISKTGPVPALVVVGNDYDYAISADNDGNADFFGTLVLTDDIPAGLTVNTIADGGFSCTHPPLPFVGPATVTCELVYTSGSPLSPGEISPTVTFGTTVTATGTLGNVARVSSPDANIPDLNPVNDTVTYGVESEAGGNSADIAVIKGVDLALLPAGDELTFTLEVTNAGPQPATNVELTDRFTSLINDQAGPSEGYVSESISLGAATGLTCSNVDGGTDARRLNCNIANLPVCTPGFDCPVVTVVVRPGGEAGPRTNTVTAFSQDVPDPDLTDNRDTVPYALEARADVTVTKAATPSIVPAGQDVVYVISAINIDNGLSTAADVSITDTLPADLTFVSATPSTGSCSVTPTPNTTTLAGSNNVITCELGDIGNGGQRTVTVVVRPNNELRGLTFDNDVVVSTTTTETDATNNETVATVEVTDPDLDLLVNKIDTVDPVARSENTEYVITVTNVGASASQNIVVTDLLPTALLTYQSVTIDPAEGSCPLQPTAGSIGGTLICEIPYLAADRSVEIRVTMQGDAKGSILNNVSITSDEIDAGFDRISGNNTISQNTTVRSRTDIEAVSKIADPTTVNVNDNFVFTALVRVNTGVALFEADDVMVTDTLPSNMVLTGTPTVNVIMGTASATTCTGAAGGTSFTCDLGTVSAGGEVEITIPVEVISVSALPQTFTNSFAVSTSSLDTDPDNNTASGDVMVGSSSLAGTIFRDFADDSNLTPGDTGIGGVEVTLTGTSFDGRMITLTTTTNPDGTYMFDFLPAGTYSVTRDPVTENYLTQGTNSVGDAPAGSPSGSLSGDDTIESITLPANTDAVNYDFAFIPQARVGIAKQLTGPIVQADDGSFVASFQMVVENLSLEDFSDVDVTDVLEGPAPLFGSHTMLTNPTTDPMPLGSYTIAGPPAGTCGGSVAGYTGVSGNDVLAANFTLGSGDTCTITVSIRVMPTDTVPTVFASGGSYENQAQVEATGALSGQTLATNPGMSDLSDDGATPDPNGNGLAGESGENDPTPLLPTYSPSIALIKVADRSQLSDPVEDEDELRYTFEVRNTGNVTLTNITVSDLLAGVTVTGTIASLAPGATDTTSITATYNLTQENVDDGFVENQATVEGTDPFGTVVDDPSGTDFTDDTPLITPFVDEPSIAIIKTADSSAFQDPPRPGDIITYSFEVINTGNVTLTNIMVTDTLPNIVITGGPIPSLLPGARDTTTFEATYAIEQDDINAGEVLNQATVTGTPPMGPDVTDESGADAGSDAPTITPITQSPSITLVKTVDESTLLDGAVEGELLNYSFVITNTGNLPLTNVTVTDLLPGITIVGNSIAQLDPLEVDTDSITASYPVTLADITAGEVNNTATVTGQFGPDPADVVTDESSVTASVGTIEAVSEVFPPFTEDGGTTTSILDSDLLNNEPATLETVTITVLSEDPGVTLDPATGLITLAPGQPAGVYQVEYQIASQLVPTLTDTAIETVVQGPRPAIEAEKTQEFVDNGDGRDDVGDVVNYTITIRNTGNMPLSNVVLTDTLTDLNGNPLTLDSGPTFVSSTLGSPEGELAFGEEATYSASFTITLQAVNAGGVENTVTVDAVPVYGPGVPEGPTSVSDISDDGNDTDGDTQSDPTQLLLAPSVPDGGLTITKVTPLNIVQRGTIVPYTITLTNTNGFVASPIDVVDRMPNGFLYVPGSATVDGVALDVSVSGNIVTWNDLTVPAESSIVLTVQSRILNGAFAGTHTNTVTALDGDTGALLTAPASATVRILPDPVFDCGEVVGRVFNDIDGDGYQDPPPIDSGITDQTYYGDKEGADEIVAPQIERGIPNVRLATVDGTIITTDENGLFSVPCAALPAGNGSNFILKLDDRSLPTGYRVTTENPRTVRLTPGTMSEVNFGVATGTVARVDLAGAAFYANDAGSPVMQPSLVAGIEQLLASIDSNPTTVRLAFHVPSAAASDVVRQARQLMDMVEDHINNRWRDIGQFPLRVEQIIVRGEP